MNLLERFEQRYQPEPNSGCWLWLGHIGKTGYGQIKMRSTDTRSNGAHRASYELFCGEIGAGALVCHRCDNRSCVNPDHLFLGSYKDNFEDAKKKGRLRWNADRKARAPKGEQHHQAKLTWGDVMRIRASDDAGIDLAQKYGVTPTQISKIRQGKAWRVDGHAS